MIHLFIVIYLLQALNISSCFIGGCSALTEESSKSSLSDTFNPSSLFCLYPFPSQHPGSSPFRGGGLAILLVIIIIIIVITAGHPCWVGKGHGLSWATHSCYITQSLKW